MDPSQALLRAATCPLYRILGAVRGVAVATRFARRGDGASRRPKPALCAATRRRFAPRHVRASRGVTLALRAAPCLRTARRRGGALLRPALAFRVASRRRFAPPICPRGSATALRPTSLRGFVRRHDGASRRPCVRAARHDGASRRRQAAIRTTTRQRFAPPICPRGVAMALRPTSLRGFDRRHDGASRRPCVRAARRRRFAPPTRRVPGHDATALRAAPRLCFSRSQDGVSRRTASMLRAATRPCAACSASRRRHDGASRRLGARASRRRRFAPPTGRIPGYDALCAPALKIKRNTSQADQPGNSFLLIFEVCVFCWPGHSQARIAPPPSACASAARGRNRAGSLRQTRCFRLDF